MITLLPSMTVFFLSACTQCHVWSTEQTFKLKQKNYSIFLALAGIITFKMTIAWNKYFDLPIITTNIKCGLKKPNTWSPFVYLLVTDKLYQLILQQMMQLVSPLDHLPDITVENNCSEGSAAQRRAVHSYGRKSTGSNTSHFLPFS